MIYNPDEFIQKLKEIINKVFIEGTTVQRISVSRLAMSLIGKKSEPEAVTRENQSAKEFEEKR